MTTRSAISKASGCSVQTTIPHKFRDMLNLYPKSAVLEWELDVIDNEFVLIARPIYLAKAKAKQTSKAKASQPKKRKYKKRAAKEDKPKKRKYKKRVKETKRKVGRPRKQAI